MCDRPLSVLSHEHNNRLRIGALARYFGAHHNGVPPPLGNPSLDTLDSSNARTKLV